MWGMKLFDVSLRDGLQSIKRMYKLSEKKDLLHTIINNYNPHSIEVGSIVDSRILPQMHDSLKLYKYCRELELNNCYLLTPNLYSVKMGIKNEVNNFSLITSVSDEFQKKNVNKTLNETKSELNQMYDILNNNNKIDNIKLYISCVRECPISGPIDINFIIDEIEYYSNTYGRINELCLSDTCGTLTFSDFKILLDKLSIFNDHKLLDKLSLHLHKNKNVDQTYNIINYAYLNGIYSYDVSCLNSGGCSVTINNDNLNNNLHYDDYNNIFFS
jgi:hydroxymethylglutaryl-CoA lyase